MSHIFSSPCTPPGALTLDPTGVHNLNCALQVILASHSQAVVHSPEPPSFAAAFMASDRNQLLS